MTFRTYDAVAREHRRRELAHAAMSAAEAFDRSATGMEMYVSGSLSRGQTHPWSDLDLVILRNGRERDPEADFELRNAIRRAVQDVKCDVVFEDEIPPPLALGMMGSLVRPEDVPDLAPLPTVQTVYARLAMSLGFALRTSRELIDAYARITRNSDISENLFREGALRFLSDKADFWLSKLAVFVDGGQSGWLDDGDEAELREMLLRLCETADAPFPRPAVMFPSSASALAAMALERSLDADVRLPHPRKAVYDLSRQASLWNDLASGAQTHGLDVPEEAFDVRFGV